MHVHVHCRCRGFLRDEYKNHLNCAHEAGRIHFLPSSQVCDVFTVIVDALHAAFEISPTSWDEFSWVGHPSKTQLWSGNIMDILEKSRSKFSVFNPDLWNWIQTNVYKNSFRNVFTQEMLYLLKKTVSV